MHGCEPLFAGTPKVASNQTKYILSHMNGLSLFSHFVCLLNFEILKKQNNK